MSLRSLFPLVGTIVLLAGMSTPAKAEDELVIKFSSREEIPSFLFLLETPHAGLTASRRSAKP
jgi:hypothetical protein